MGQPFLYRTLKPRSQIGFCNRTKKIAAVQKLVPIAVELDTSLPCLALAWCLKNPHVTINVLEYVTQGASLLGEVLHPGIYPVLGSRRLYEPAPTIA